MDNIFNFDGNRRVYNEAAGGGPLYRGHFVMHHVIREEKRSWVIKEFGSERKVAKYMVDQPHGKWFSEDGMNDNVWDHENRWPLRDKVAGCSLKALRAIAKIIEEDKDESAR